MPCNCTSRSERDLHPAPARLVAGDGSSGENSESRSPKGSTALLSELSQGICEITCGCQGPVHCGKERCLCTAPSGNLPIFSLAAFMFYFARGGQRIPPPSSIHFQDGRQKLRRLNDPRSYSAAYASFMYELNKREPALFRTFLPRCADSRRC